MPRVLRAGVGYEPVVRRRASVPCSGKRVWHRVPVHAAVTDPAVFFFPPGTAMT